MKHGKRPTVKQCRLLQANRLNSNNWLVVKDLNDTMLVVNRESGKMREISKEVDT